MEYDSGRNLGKKQMEWYGELEFVYLFHFSHVHVLSKSLSLILFSW